jgi:hypothetical protein
MSLGIRAMLPSCGRTVRKVWHCWARSGCNGQLALRSITWPWGVSGGRPAACRQPGHREPVGV